MENPRSQIKVAMNYGGYYGLSGVITFLAFYFIGTDMQSKLPQLLGYVLLIVFMVMGIKSYRDEDLGGSISYGCSLGTGILISIFGGIITGAFTVLFFSYIAPEMTQKILDQTEQGLLEGNMSEAQVEQAMTYTRKFMAPGWLFVFSILGSAFMGFIFSLIVSIFLRKNQDPFQSQQV